MSRPNESLETIKARREGALSWFTKSIPYVTFLGLQFDRRGDELTAIFPYQEKFIGNPFLPALHGGATAAFLEYTAIVTLSMRFYWNMIESGQLLDAEKDRDALPRLPKTVDFSIDYLRSGLPRDAYARARVTRFGRRYASVFVEGWQDLRDKPFIQATGHFVMPEEG